MKGQRRRRLDAHTWRELLQRFDAAGTTVGEFCAREGLNASSLYRWRERLRSAGMQPLSAGVEQRTGASVPSGATGFIDLGGLTQSSLSAGGVQVRLDLGGGLVLQILRC
jgi:Transposase